MITDTLEHSCNHAPFGFWLTADTVIAAIAVLSTAGALPRQNPFFDLWLKPVETFWVPCTFPGHSWLAILAYIVARVLTLVRLPGSEALSR